MSLWCGWVDVHRSKRQRRVASERYWADVSDAEVVFYSAQQPPPEAAAEHGGGGGPPPISQRRAHIRWDTVEEVVAEVPRGVAAFFEVTDDGGAGAAAADCRSSSPRRRHHVGLRSGEMWVVVRLATLQDARRWQDIHRLFSSAPAGSGNGAGAEAVAAAVATADSSSPPSSPSPKHLPPSFSNAAATPPSARVSLRSVSPPVAAPAASGAAPESLGAVLPLVARYKTLLKAKLLRAENLDDLFAAESVAFPNRQGGGGGGAGADEGEEGLRFFPTCKDAVLDRLNRGRFEEAAHTISTLRLRCAALEEEKDGLRRRLASAEAAAAGGGGGGGGGEAAAVAALRETLASERRRHAAAEQAWAVERRGLEGRLRGSEVGTDAVSAAAAAASPLPSPRGLSARASAASQVSPLPPPQPVAATTTTATLASSATPSLLALPLLQQTVSTASTDIEPRPLPPPTPHCITPMVSPALLPSQGAAGRGVTAAAAASEDVEAYATCHVCGNHHPATALAMHLPNCLRAWYAAQKTVPMECRQVRPPSAPSGVLPLENLAEYNRLAHQVYLTQARNRCTRCLMRFDAPTLTEHLAVCGILP